MLLFLVLIVFLTVSKIHDKHSFSLFLTSVKNLNVCFIIALFAMVLIYFVLQGLYMKIILNVLNKKVSIIKCIFYSMVEFYFSGITPSSTGGQPLQLYYMTKDKIPIRKSYITLMLNTVYFKIIILILGIIGLIYNGSYLVDNHFIYKFFFALGFVLDLLMVVLCLYFIFRQKVINKVLSKLLNIGKKFKMLRKKLDKYDVDEISVRYKDEIDFVKSHKLLVLIGFIITFIQRLVLFSVAYVVYRSLGFNALHYTDLLFMQILVQITIEAIPLPGGAGVSEGMLYNLFGVIFTSHLAATGMLLTRTFSFYIPLLLSGIIILLYNIISHKKQSVDKRKKV